MNQSNSPCQTESAPWAGPTNLVHCVHIPPTASAGQPAPLVVMIHGWAGDESSMWVFRQALPPGVVIVAPRAPVALPEGGYGWFTYSSRLVPEPGSLAAGLRQLEEFINSLPGYYPVDPNRLVVMGFSQGAMIGNAFVYANPDRAVGMASLAGAFPPVIEGDPINNWLAGLPVFIAHGREDDVVPVEHARQTKAVYQSLGAAVTYGEYRAAHKMHMQGLKDLRRWLEDVLKS